MVNSWVSLAISFTSPSLLLEQLLLRLVVLSVCYAALAHTLTYSNVHTCHWQVDCRDFPAPDTPLAMMELSRSTQSYHRALSDAGIDPIEGSVEGRVEGRAVRHLGLVILCPQRNSL